MNYFSKVYGYLRSFGLKDGFYITILQALRGLGIRYRNENKKKWVFVRTLAQKVCIRPGTTDYDLLLDFFFKRSGTPMHYDIDFIKFLKGETPKYVLDAGANIGFFSLLCEERYHPEIILSVEPESSNYDLLCLNTKDRKNIVCIKTGIWKRKAALKVVPSITGKWGFTVKECENDGDVAGISVTDLMEENKIPYFDIVKMDIEGSEYHIFEDNNCEEWLSKTKILIIETHDVLIKGCTDTVMTRMTDMGFHSFTEGEDIVFYKE